MEWPWISRKKYNKRVTQIEYLFAQHNALIRSLKNATDSNKKLSGEVNDSNKYARALEKTWDGKQSPARMDYGKVTEENLHKRISVTLVTRPDIMSRNMEFRLRFPEDWERVFGKIDNLIHFIESEVRTQLE
jgi:hypothetical protein